MIAIKRKRTGAYRTLDEERNSRPTRQLISKEFEALLSRNESRIRSFIVTLSLPLSEVDDVFQNTCIVALRKLDAFSYTGTSPDESFVRWLCTIARFESLQLLRSKRVSRVTFDSALVETLADMQLRDMELLRDRWELLADCLERLTDWEKCLICLRYGENLRVAEVACRIGYSENGVYKALERIRSRLLSRIQVELNNRQRARCDQRR